jgi:hypothetical protein
MIQSLRENFFVLIEYSTPPTATIASETANGGFVGKGRLRQPVTRVPALRTKAPVPAGQSDAPALTVPPRRGV